MNKKLLWITQTAVILALIVIFQFATKGLPVFVTGSIVNLLLIIGGLLIGLGGGLTLAGLSPVFALLLGVQPPQTAFLVPVIIIGNMIIVLVTWYFSKESKKLSGPKKVFTVSAGVLIGAGLKFFVLWAVITQLLLPILNLPAPLNFAMSFSFSWPQLVTALIGGTVAFSIYPIVAKGIKSKE